MQITPESLRASSAAASSRRQGRREAPERRSAGVRRERRRLRQQPPQEFCRLLHASRLHEPAAASVRAGMRRAPVPSHLALLKGVASRPAGHSIEQAYGKRQAEAVGEAGLTRFTERDQQIVQGTWCRAGVWKGPKGQRGKWKGTWAAERPCLSTEICCSSVASRVIPSTCHAYESRHFRNTDPRIAARCGTAWVQRSSAPCKRVCWRSSQPGSYLIRKQHRR